MIIMMIYARLIGAGFVLQDPALPNLSAAQLQRVAIVPRVLPSLAPHGALNSDR